MNKIDNNNDHGNNNNNVNGYWEEKSKEGLPVFSQTGMWREKDRVIEIKLCDNHIIIIYDNHNFDLF